MAVELLASIQPLIFFQHEAEHMLSIQNILYYYASPGSVIWQRIAVSINVILLRYFFKRRSLSYSVIVIITAGCLRLREIAGSHVRPRSFDRALRRFLVTLFTC